MFRDFKGLKPVYHRAAAKNNLTKMASEDFDKIQAIYNSLPADQKLFVAPKGRLVDSPYSVYRHIDPEDKGFVELYKFPGVDKKRAFITMAVSPEAQGKGIGKQLVRKAIAEAKLRRDIEAIIYKVDNGNIASSKLGSSVGKLKKKTPEFTEYEIDTIRDDWNEYKRTKKIFDKLIREQQDII